MVPLKTDPTCMRFEYEKTSLVTFMEFIPILQSLEDLLQGKTPLGFPWHLGYAPLV